MQIEMPEKAAPRSVALGPLESAASLPRALELGVKRIGMGAFRTLDCDPFGRMRTEQVIARISDSAAHLMSDLLTGLAEGGERSLGAVVLEYRFVFLAWPRAGDRYELRSGMVGAEPRVRRMVHWFLDPASGRPWATAEAVAAVFDLATRKTVALTEAELIPWAEASVAGLSI
jgi:acyl-CoA thioester hydrolase